MHKKGSLNLRAIVPLLVSGFGIAGSLAISWGIRASDAKLQFIGEILIFIVGGLILIDRWLA